MKIAIVDDSEVDRKQLISYIKGIACELNFEAEVFAHSLGENFLEDEDLSVIDAVFLDIYMGQKNGLEVAKALRDRGYQGIIIFCTTTPHFALEGYSVKAMNYILKPFSYEKIAQQLKDIHNMLGKSTRAIRVKDGRQWCRINLSDILFIEKQGNYVCVHTFSKTYSVRTALSEMEGQLFPYGCFVKCDRGIIVNMESIQEIQGNTILLKNHSLVPISRSHKSMVSERYFNFIFEKME